MPQALQDPLIIGLILVAIVVVAAIIIIIRRRRAAAADDSLPIPEISTTDYTSMAYEEPSGPFERFQRASPAVKALVVLVPLVLIGAIAAVLLLVQPQPTGAPPAPTPIPQATLTIRRAEVAGTGKIVVEGESTYLAVGSAVTALLNDGGQEFPWYNKDTAIGQPDSQTGQIFITLDRISGAPVPQPDRTYEVVLIGTQLDGSVIRSAPQQVIVLAPFSADFYQSSAAAPTATPTVEPQQEPTATAEVVAATPEPVETPVESTAPLTGTVRVNGNIREEPNRQGTVLGQVSEGELVTLLARAPDGAWYRLEASEATGWVSATLLEVPEAAASLPAEVPSTAQTAIVFNGGNVRTAPNLNGIVIDQINATETVTLLARNDEGTWYQIINERQITGWVSATLLTVSLEARRDLPVSSDTVPTPLPTTQQALPQAGAPAATPEPTEPTATGLTAVVFNGGNVRAAPNLAGQVLDQINARETVQLLARTEDSNWYQITNIRGVTGWVNRTLLTVDPEVARRVPVSE
jgi:flagellar FliL protein